MSRLPNDIEIAARIKLRIKLVVVSNIKLFFDIKDVLTALRIRTIGSPPPIKTPIISFQYRKKVVDSMETLLLQSLTPTFYGSKSHAKSIKYIQMHVEFEYIFPSM